MSTRITRDLVLALLGVAIGLPGAAAAQRQQAGRLAFPAELSVQTRDTLQWLADSARSAGIPAEAIAGKAAEGVLKGADDARIIRAARSLLRELMIARDALPPAAAPGTLAAGASALHAGVSPQTLRRLARSGENAQQSNLGVALVTLADLVASRVPAESAASSVEQLLRRNAPEGEMAAFRTAIARDIEAGRPPEAALQSRTRALVRSLDSRADGSLSGRRP